MAIKPFNTLGGLTVGQNLTPVIDANNNASFNDLTANGNVVFNSADFNLSGNAAIAGTLSVTGEVSLSSQLSVTGDLTANGITTLNDDATINGSLQVNGAIGATGAVTLGDTLSVTGAATLSNALGVTGATTLSSTLDVTGAASLSSTLGVTGATTLSSTLDVAGAVSLDSTLDVASSANIGANLTVVGQTNLGQIANVHVLGGTSGQVLKTDGAGNLYWDQIDPMSQGDTSIDIDNVTGYVNLTVNGVANVLQVTESGLSATGTANIAGDTEIGGALVVDGNISTSSSLNTTGSVNAGTTLSVASDATVGGTLGVTGATSLDSTLAVASNANIGGTLGVVGAATLDSSLMVTGIANLSSTLGVAGAASLASTLDVTGATTLASTLDVTGATTLSSTLDVTSDANIGGQLTVSSGLSVTGNIATSSALTVAASANIGTTLGVAGDLTVASATFLQGSLDVTGDTALAGELAVTGLSSFNSDVAIDANLSAIGISASTGSFSVSLNTADLTATGQVTLGNVGNVHIAGGTDGQVLKTDGAGNLTWETNAILVNGTSSVDIPVADGNVNISVGGVANVVTVGTSTTIVNNDLQVIGNLIISGTQTDVNVTNLNVQDPVITEGRGANNAPLTLNDGLDRGLHSYYFDGDAEAEKGAFIGFKNPSAASADAGKFVIASDATLTDNVTTVNSYADVVVNSVQSGFDGGASRVELGEGQVNIVADGTTVVQVDPWGVQITGTNRFYGELRNNDLDETTGAQITTYATTQVAVATIADNRPGAVLEVTLRGIDVVSGKMEVNKFMVLTNAAGQVDYTGTSTLRLIGNPGTVDFITTSTGVTSGDMSIVVTPASTNQTNWVATYTRML